MDRKSKASNKRMSFSLIRDIGIVGCIFSIFCGFYSVAAANIPDITKVTVNQANESSVDKKPAIVTQTAMK